MTRLELSPDELLATTRAVRRRLDLERPVERGAIEECLRLAQQAPTASNMQNWHFVVVTDREKRAALADLYRRGVEEYTKLPVALVNLEYDDPARTAQQKRITASSAYLWENLKDVPVHVVPCIRGRTEGMPSVLQSAIWGTIAPATWSFMLAARARGLGTVWTSLHLFFEREAAEVLGIPYDEVQQTALVPLAHTKGTDFRPAAREPLENMVHWDAW